MLDQPKLCSKCKAVKTRAEFFKNNARKDGLQSNCKSCHMRVCVRWNSSPQGKRYVRSHRLKRNYNLSQSEYDALLDEQHFSCKVCRTHTSELGRQLDVDHDHLTGKVRGLLCNKCNQGIGLFNDDPTLLLAAQSYLTLAARL